MTPFHWIITSCSLFLFLSASAPTARAQVFVGVDDRPNTYAVHPSSLEAAIYLELYGHPDTARRNIQVHARRDHIELTGTVANEFERLTALRISAEAALDLAVRDQLNVKSDGPFPRLELPRGASPVELNRRFTDILAAQFPAEILRELSLTVYRVDQQEYNAPGAPTPKLRVRTAVGWVVVLEGLVPTVRDQLAMSELLLFEYPVAMAVINRTYVAEGYAPAYRSKTRVRVPLVDVDVGEDNGVVVQVGPLVVRTGGRQRAVVDPSLPDEFTAAVRADSYLRDAPLHSHLVGGVLMIDGTLKVADKMRAVALAITLSGVRGVVDRTEIIQGRPDYYRDADLAAYLSYRLGEHAGARSVEIIPIARNRLKVQATISTDFHAALATSVIASDPALSWLPIEPTFRDAHSGAILSPRS